MNRFLLLITSLSLSFSSFAEPLTTSKIKPIISKLSNYHIEVKNVNSLIIQRALSCYINKFDQQKNYLLSNEVQPFSSPSEETLKTALIDYNNEKFEIFALEHEVIKNSILRAQQLRAELIKNPNQLIEEASKISTKDIIIEKQFASNIADLKIRQKNLLLYTVMFNLKDYKDRQDKQFNKKLITFCEKQIKCFENSYLGLDEDSKPLSDTSKENLFSLSVIKSLANSFDSHTAYFSEEETQNMKLQLEKSLCGIGIVLKDGVDGVYISDVISGGPADKTKKIQKLDLITNIDNVNTSHMSLKKVIQKLKGKENTKVNIELSRNGSPFNVEITRQKIILEDKRIESSYEPFGNGIIGKISLYSFYEDPNGSSSESDIKAAISKFRENSNLKGLILDLRENTGGFLSQAIKVAGLFMSNGVVVSSKYSNDIIKYYRSSNSSKFYNGPLVILVSKISASATEIVAQTLQDYGLALIIGDKHTYGKGTIQHQTITSADCDHSFKVTIGKYYTVSGKSTQLSGVQSDIVVNSRYSKEELGETFSEYPLNKDSHISMFEDNLEDLPLISKKMIEKTYKQNLQKKNFSLISLLPTLRRNSELRLNDNKNFQNFLSSSDTKAESKYGLNDLQMEESIAIVKDILVLSK